MRRDLSTWLGSLYATSRKAKHRRGNRPLKARDASSKISLSGGEPLDPRKMLAVTANLVGTGLTISLDAEYTYIVYTGAKYWLIRMGQRPGDPRIAGVVYADTERAWTRALTDYVVAESNDATETMGLDRDP